MKIKTSELTGAALNWAVAKCDNRQIGFNLGSGLEVRGRTEDGEELPEYWDLYMPWHPSTDWAQGGPIIEREKIDCIAEGTGKDMWMSQLYATRLGGESVKRAYGPTPLIAAMRCLVASKLGDTVDILEELLV